MQSINPKPSPTPPSLRLQIRTGKLPREAQSASPADAQLREPDDLLAPCPALEDDPSGVFDCSDLSSQLQ